MLSLHGLGAAGAGAAGYYAALARDDYYTRGGEPPGDWLGRGAASLGLSGTVDAAALRHVLHGFDGAGAAAGVQGAGTDHHAGWDLTFSAPKSVSVLWATTDDPASGWRGWPSPRSSTPPRASRTRSCTPTA